MKLICKDTLKKPNRKSLKNIGVFGAQTLKLATLEVLQFLLKKEAFWAAKPLQFPTDHPCHAFYQDNRLIAVQVWFGRGGTSLIVYSIYGISGSRWETHKKAYLHKLLKSIELDRIARGQIPCVLLGDLIWKLQNHKSFLKHFHPIFGMISVPLVIRTISKKQHVIKVKGLTLIISLFPPHYLTNVSTSRFVNSKNLKTIQFSAPTFQYQRLRKHKPA